ncbi:MAG: TerB family tellurite resistance protein [Nannocystaceae bacterium]|nr:TerB family tellurite resistance protein [Nannocystaceae bacterium]
MDAAAVFALGAGLDRRDPRVPRAIERARVRAGERGGLWPALVDHERLLDDAAALAVFVLDGRPQADDDEALQLLIAVATLALALDRATSLLLGPTPEASLGNGRLESALRGEFDGLDPDLPQLLAGLRQALSQRPGWPSGCAGFCAALGNAVEGIAREQTLGGLGTTVAVRDAAETAGVDLVAATAAIVCDDRTMMTHPSECELALRLGNGVVGRARDVVAFAGGFGPLRPEQLVAHRFGIPAGVIRLGHAEIERCLRALFAAELLDLADLLRGMDRSEPLPHVVARACQGLLELHGCDEELVIASVAPEHDAIMNELRVVARLDGRITADERAILRGMDAHLHAFEELLGRIAEDRVLDFEEFGQLRTARQAILDDLLRIALADDVVTDDERSLLVRALELLPMLRPLRPR